LSSKHSGVPEDSQPPTFPSVRLHPHTWPKWGCDIGGSRGSTSSTASMGALVLEGLGGLTGEAVKFVGAGASELMLHFPNTTKKVFQNRPGYSDWAGKCSKLISELISELGPSAFTHLSGHPIPGAARQFGEIRHFCISYRIPRSVEPWSKPNGSRSSLYHWKDIET